MDQENMDNVKTDVDSIPVWSLLTVGLWYQQEI